jgi:hypothetical protein
LDTFNCENLYPVIRTIFVSEKHAFDFAANGHDELPWHPDNGVKLLWWSERMRLLLFLWEESQLKRGIESSDQQALMEMLKTHPDTGLKFARLPTSLSCRLRPAVGEHFAMKWAERHHSQSMPIYGPLYILHMDGVQKVYKEICGLVNAKKEQTRVLTYTHPQGFPHDKETAQKAFAAPTSEKECNAVLEGKCFPQLHWAAQAFQIKAVPREDFQY